MKAIVNAVVVRPDSVIKDGTVIFDENIKEVGQNLHIGDAEVIDAKGSYVMPGFIDIHIHGYMGCDTSDGDRDGLIKIARNLTRNGVTAFCPTTMTVAMSDIQKALDLIGELKEKNDGAKILGANVEGPFINPKKKGAQDDKYIKAPDIDFVMQNAENIKLVTLAPETDMDLKFTRYVSHNTDIAISVGHTDATYEQTSAAFKSGARHVTHLFNAMTPFSHRAVGVIGAALENDNVSCELIADTFHISPVLFGIVERLKGDKLVLITDCMRAGGMPDGEYTLGGQPVTVRGIECRLKDGTIAGSILTLNGAVRNFLKNTDLPIYKVVNMASLNPSRVIGEDTRRGSIEVGKYADLVIADGDVNIKSTIIHGEKQF